MNEAQNRFHSLYLQMSKCIENKAHFIPNQTMVKHFSNLLLFTVYLTESDEQGILGRSKK